ncbi:MAG: retroviral-like aspartic protease family protein [Pseudomonadota bacterium]
MHHVWSLPLAALTLVGLGQQPAEESVTPNLADPATEILGLDEERNNRMTLPVTIDGTGPYDFMIDTGSQATAVTHEINEALSLQTLGTATLVGMASVRPVEVVEVDNLKMGSHIFNSVSAPVLNRTHVGADGIIGLDTLQDFRVLIDFRDETIAVEDVTEKKASTKGFEIVVRARSKLGQLLITDAVVEGVRATVIIDTGAQASLGNSALRDRLRAKREQEVITTDVNGVTLAGSMSYVRTLSIGGISLRNVPVTFADAPAFDHLGIQDKPVLSLGMEHLKMFDRVAIDFTRQRVLFDLPRKVARDLRRAKRNTLGAATK